MFEALEARARALGKAAAERARRRIAARVRDEIAGVAAEETEAGVVLRGRRLADRMLVDPRLRWIWEWLR